MHSICFLVLILFLPESAHAVSCSGCHPAPPQDKSHILHSGVKELAPSYGNTGITRDYSFGASAYGFNCGNCHPLGSEKHQNGVVDVELYTKGAYGLKKLNSPDAHYDGKKKTCSGVYCHSTGGKIDISYRESPAWKSNSAGNRCQSCHGSPPSYKGTDRRPNGHFNIERGSGHLLGIHWDSVGGHTKESFRHKTATQMGCSTCHYLTVRTDSDTTFEDRAGELFTCARCHDKRDGQIFNFAVHVDGEVEIAFAPVTVRSKAQMVIQPKGWKRMGKPGEAESCDEAEVPLDRIVYDSHEKSCSNVFCHLLAKKVRWADSVDCIDCHTDTKTEH
jgi:predicted CxxxxCH...CXXCH cytochrome family protein